MKIFAGQILSCNVKANGIKSCLFSFGLGRAEFIEFSYVMSELAGKKGDIKILDVGSGHSLTSLLLNHEVVVLDIDKDSLLWQLQRSKSMKTKTTSAIRASAEMLPFRDGVFDAATAISSLEHLSDNMDVTACKEISRVLVESGLAIISVPGSRSGSTTVNKGNMVGLPRWAGMFGGLLPQLFTIFEVDRSFAFVERRYAYSDAKKRLVPGFIKKSKIDGYTLGRSLSRIINAVYPYSLVTFLDLILASRVRPLKSPSSSESPTAGLIIVSFQK